MTANSYICYIKESDTTELTFPTLEVKDIGRRFSKSAVKLSSLVSKVSFKV